MPRRNKNVRERNVSRSAQRAGTPKSPPKRIKKREEEERSQPWLTIPDEPLPEETAS